MQKRLVVVRAVHVHKPFANRREDVQCRRRAVDELTICSRAREGAFEDELIFLARLKAVFFEKSFQRRAELFHVEHGLDGATVAAAADERTIGAFAEDEVERSDDDGLARAGLAGDDVAAGLEFERHVRHEREVFNAERRQHFEKVRHNFADGW